MPTSQQILRFLRSRLRGITLRCLDRDGFIMITDRELSNLFPNVEFPQSRNGSYKLCSSPGSSFVVAESWFCDQPDEFFATFPFTDGISWKEQLGPIRHQHNHRLCATFAAVDLVRAHSIIANRGLVNLSVWYLSQMVDPDCLLPRRSQPHHRCYRSHVDTVLSYIKSEGAPLRFDFEERENPELFCYYPVPRPVPLVTLPISSIETIDSLTEALMSLHLGPITASLLVFPELYTIEDGIYRGPTEQNSTLQNYHAVNICSVDYHVCGEPVAICKLSDGVEIGIEGYVYVSLSIVLKFLSDGFSSVPVHLLRDFVILEMEPVEIEQETRMEKGENSQSSRETPPPPPKEDCPFPPHRKEDCPPSQSFHSARVGEDVSEVDAYEYMVEYSQTNKLAGRLENVVGWYRSHPGYGCRLSGIDVSTQMLNQQYQEPFLAVVIDPTRTVSAGKVEIGALRTYPERHKLSDDHVSEYQTIPLNKIEDFGVDCKQYYLLDMAYLKSSLDSHLLYLLWTKYWLNTLSSSPLLGNGAETVEQAESQLAHSRFGGIAASLHRKKEDEPPLAKITRDIAKINVEQVHGLTSQVIRDILFNSACQSEKTPSDPLDPKPLITS